MRTKLYIYCTNDEEFLKGSLDWCLNASTNCDLGGAGWTIIGETHVELNMDETAAKARMLDKLEASKNELLAKVEMIEIKKKELLSIEYKQGKE